MHKAQSQWRPAKKLKTAELWRHPEGHKFIKFTDTPLRPNEIPHPKEINGKDHEGINFVTNMLMNVGGKKETVWAKEAGSDFDHQGLKRFEQEFRESNHPYLRNMHQAIILRQLRRAGFYAPEPLGILYPKGKERPFLIVRNLEGEKRENISPRFMQNFLAELSHAGFFPMDVDNPGNVRIIKLKSLDPEKQFGMIGAEGKPITLGIIDASVFGPTDLKRMKKYIEGNKK